MTKIKSKSLKIIVLALCIALTSGFIPSTVFAETTTNSVLNLGNNLAAHSQIVQIIGEEEASINAFFAKAEKQLEQQDAIMMKTKLRQDVQNLATCGIRYKDISSVTAINEKIRYELKFDGFEKKVWTEVSSNKQGDVILRINEEGLENVLRFTADERLFIDGHEIIFETQDSEPLFRTSLGDVALPNKTSNTFRKNPFDNISTSDYDKLIKKYTNNNIELGNFLSSFTATAIATVIMAAVKKAFSKTMPGLVVSFFTTVAQTILNNDVAHGPEDAYLSFEIEKKKCTAKSTTYEQFYIHKGKYYSRKNCEGTKYPHNFYEYGYLDTL
ncbi:MAG: hypothetical protein MR303_03890 [Emergencia sp.]|nr:hypothetical protein [Emergencia sp.]